ncbi:MAG: 6-pyruvoyl tetrahydrobiopterin synthase [Acidobacteria bacterium]|nr:MAG: 6-pyruvoyl tetrahydrobiopterin synthase [Acidobacteriota bacterium]
MRLELTRRYALAASHRLNSPHLDEAENERIYGKCNNPYGHGHNYIVEVTVSGKVDPATGMIADLGELDGYVAREIIEPFDHMYLNKDVEAFRDHVPTTENLCMEIFERLKQFPSARLVRIRLEETGRNSFEYAGQGDGDER